MKIVNAFSLNMVQQMPAQIACSRISLEQIKDMISDSPAKKLARELIQKGLRAEVDEGSIWLSMNGMRTVFREWEDDSERIQKLPEIGIEASEENFAAVEAAIWGETCVVVLESVIGHADTAAIVSGILGVELPANRASVKLERGEKMIVAQYSGPRLPEGATQLPEGAKIEFILVEVN